MFPLSRLPIANRRADDAFQGQAFQDRAFQDDDEVPVKGLLGDLATVTGLVAVAVAIVMVWTMGSDFGGSAGALANF